jgi:hypothetical protein
MLTSIFAALLEKCPSETQRTIFYSLIAAGFGLLFPKTTEKSTFSYRGTALSFAGVGTTAFLLALIANPLSLLRSDQCSLTSFSVLVRGKKGPDDIILRNKGYVLLTCRGEPKKKSIDENGEAIFQNLMPGDTFSLAVDFSQNYRATKPDSTYKVTSNGWVYFIVELRGIDKIHGRVMFDDTALKDVTVSIDGIPNKKTDSFGFFEIEIPELAQQESYEVWFSKKGFKSIPETVYPETGAACNIIMTKIH